VGYSYSVETGNRNGRTLQYFSTSANERMRVDGLATGNFYADFQKVSESPELNVMSQGNQQLTY
jgi:hypothetical protein